MWNSIRLPTEASGDELNASLLWSERVKKFDNKYDLFTGSLFTV